MNNTQDPSAAPTPPSPHPPPASALQNAMLASVGLAIIATDEKGVIQFFNNGAERMLGYSAADVVGKLSPNDLHDQDELIARALLLGVELQTTIQPGFDALAGKASQGRDDLYELTYICKDGRRIPAMVSIAPLLDEQGKCIGYLLMSSGGALRTRVALNLSNAKLAAEKASLTKSDFLVALSHELRTPLNAILGFAQLMESGTPPPPPSQKQNLNQILVAGRYLLDLSNEILDLAMLESHETTLLLEAVPLNEVIDECRTMIEPQAKRRHVSMTFPSSDLPRSVSADRTRLKQVLMNILTNAMIYNKPGGAVAVSFTPSPVTPGAIRINVRDTGKGLAPDQIDDLFQPFNRLGQQAGQEEGAGIGLVVSKKLLEMMGGRIGAESVPGEGSVFWIELDAATALATAAPSRVEPADTAQSAHARTLLYIEDNAANMELVRQIVARRPDLRLLTASDGTLGIASARANQPDLILMDVNLPGLSGIEAMQILRRDPSTAHIPIVAVSANAMPRDIERGMAAGFLNYVTKPIRVDLFMDAVDAALNTAPIARERGKNA
ncbi:MAG: ATP-binding protein [Usitatibacteraceae bacterium]